MDTTNDLANPNDSEQEELTAIILTTQLGRLLSEGQCTIGLTSSTEGVIHVLIHDRKGAVGSAYGNSLSMAVHTAYTWALDRGIVHG
jgi:hypothetical protein